LCFYKLYVHIQVSVMHFKFEPFQKNLMFLQKYKLSPNKYTHFLLLELKTKYILFGPCTLKYVYDGCGTWPYLNPKTIKIIMFGTCFHFKKMIDNIPLL